jgi:GTPase SAR1 family protein
LGNGSVGKTAFLRALVASSKSKRDKAPKTRRYGFLNLLSLFTFILSRRRAVADWVLLVVISTIGADSENTLEITKIELKNHLGAAGTEKLSFVAFDFNKGAEVFPATHPFLVSGQALYVLVFDLLKPEEETAMIGFWLQSLKEKGAADCPIILIGTHLDDKKCTAEYALLYMLC